MLERIKTVIIAFLGAMLFLMIFCLGVLQTSYRYDPPKPIEKEKHPFVIRLLLGKEALE